jgi:pseudouridylate synthase
MHPNYLALSPEVEAAIAQHVPVVALESTIIAHGMPYPRNVDTALRVEQVVRDAGAVPATCAILKGVIRAGLNSAEIEYLGKNGREISKVSRRDLPWIISQKQNGATTVASTMIAAHIAGIRIFATGGIGGVHRGATQTLDISADLQELANTPVAVVSAGAKSILDIGLTLEYLETMGVPVLGYQTPDFPAFYARTSGFQVDYPLNSAKEIADLLHVKWTLDAKGGVLIANPVPYAYALPAAAMEQVIEMAVKEAEQKNIKGKALTPYLLAKIEEMTGGSSLATNIELVCNNARLAAEIAVAYTGV